MFSVNTLVPIDKTRPSAGPDTDVKSSHGQRDPDLQNTSRSDTKVNRNSGVLGITETSCLMCTAALQARRHLAKQFVNDGHRKAEKNSVALAKDRTTTHHITGTCPNSYATVHTTAHNTALKKRTTRSALVMLLSSFELRASSIGVTANVSVFWCACWE
ncbi:hypothetical protein PoB_005761700 [Plakobranchus ocellatus]|uniref:Uncharacterized protein n=1 Tax=Plakobranchus ocellatus TaxID=259542 RepID=A0AAV4CIF4_9GAST|nr:hypothetical protein PoB_005761700 [Plakobranchus ocellatus]